MKKSNRTLTDPTIIEQLACNEINRSILLPPFHLTSEINWNDKGLSYDGQINLFNNYIDKIKKDDFQASIPVQIKGTTSNKKLSEKGVIKHSVGKKDLEVYYKEGKGVLYFVVTINPINYKKQIYYKILAPLDLNSLLIDLNETGNASISISFKKLQDGSLENICIQFKKIIERQPKEYINMKMDREYEDYKIYYAKIKDDPSFDIYDEPFYLSGVTNGYEMPIATVNFVKAVTKKYILLKLEKNILKIKLTIQDSQKHQYIIIEDSLFFKYNKFTKKMKFELKKIKSLDSHLKCLKILNHLREYGGISINEPNFIDIKISLSGREKSLLSIEKTMNKMEELVKIFTNLGISTKYIFDDDENIEYIFNAMLEVFKDKQFQYLKNKEGEELQDAYLHKIRISKHIKVMVLFDDNKNEFYDFFSEKALNKIGGFVPKNNDAKLSEETKNLFKVSLYSTQIIKDMQEATNFKFHVLKCSFTGDYHDAKAEITKDIVLRYITHYDQAAENKYLDIAENLLKRYIQEDPEDIFSIINMYQIDIRKKSNLSEKKKHHIICILEEAKEKQKWDVCFACEVLLKDETRAQIFFGKLNQYDQNFIKEYPIYHLYQSL